MKTAFSIVAICLLAACGGAGGSMGPQVASSSFDAEAEAEQQRVEMVESSVQAVAAAPVRTFESMLNDVRSVNGADPVRPNALLLQAAQGHADDMLAQNYFSHTSKDGRQLRDRVNATGYEWRRIGENIGKGQRNEEQILLGWVNSEGHQRNNVDPRFEEFGLAKAGSGGSSYWVLVLADPR
jgi:uncharacterized protein YkwD